ncbi:hypothetical protein SAMN05443545_103139 [Aidingimonas halophila]|uniref:Uncharacterized protein n=1 Tax=Aidingimonas halophila TaxID=574349 RepID=A0A1H2XAC4_9GAMM|nr:hypothetical protein SAMN05443545_103139 [Aidingimonas halophila]
MSRLTRCPESAGRITLIYLIQRTHSVRLLATAISHQNLPKGALFMEEFLSFIPQQAVKETTAILRFRNQ